MALGRKRQASLWVLAAGVLLAHLLLADRVLEQRLGWGSADPPARRIEVSFVRELLAAAPPVIVAAPRAVPARRLPAVAAKPRHAASAVAEPVEPPATEVVAADPPAPELAASAPVEPMPTWLASTDPAPAAAPLPPDRPPPSDAEASPPVAADPPVAAPQAAAAASVAASAVRFAWPPSTRLTYQLNGHYRGPVEGSAQVEWLHEGSRYQVRMSTSIGPILSRSISSEGELTASGLAPRRFDGEQKVLFRAAKRWSLRFGPERITLPDGREIDTQPGAQDEASQFVQLTWLFTTQPERLRVGQVIELPLIVGRRLDPWVYDVVAEELLHLGFGAVSTFHLKPRREARLGELTAEIWFAPTLQYLPVRILIHQNQDTWVDLTLDEPPLQAADPAQPR
jgi:uncharacterized protein YbdZ (MbtH family)